MQEIIETPYVVRNLEAKACKTCGGIHDHITRQCEKVGFTLDHAVQFAGREGVWEQAPDGSTTVPFQREPGRKF